MDNIIFLPTRDLLSQAYGDINQTTTHEKRIELFNVLAERVREHSEELKRYMNV